MAGHHLLFMMCSLMHAKSFKIYVLSSPAYVAEKFDIIIIMLPTSINVKPYSGANGLFKKVRKGSLLTDSSTTDLVVLK